MKHTSGPWTITDSALYPYSIVSAATEDPICEIRLPNAAANARLIAAAPELLETLRVTAGNIRSLRLAKVCNTYDNWLEVVEAAIAKAGGGIG